MKLLRVATLLAACCFSSQSNIAAIVGTNTPSQPVTAQRIASLPRAERAAWKQYLTRSERQWETDQAFMRRELQLLGTNRVTVPPQGRASSLPLNRKSEWYSGMDARRLADIVVSFQTPAGGWSKNLDFSQHSRARGEHFAPDNATRFPSADDHEVSRDFAWNYVGTFDNDATTTQLRFLARVISALDERAAKPYREAFDRGLDYVMAAQYPNGGWPQVWPLQHGYHDSITFNDGGMTRILTLLRDVADGTTEFGFVSKGIRQRANESLQRGINCLLRTQVVVNGRRTVWGQQHDALTLQPTSARNYEMPSLASSESADIAVFLMRLPNPSQETVSTINAAANWFAKTPLRDVAFRNVGNNGRQLISEKGSGPLWSRYYEIGSDRPVFGDRDKSIHDDVNEISIERRRGYAWFTDKGKAVLEEYQRWKRSRAN